MKAKNSTGLGMILGEGEHWEWGGGKVNKVWRTIKKGVGDTALEMPEHTVQKDGGS